MWPVVCKGHVSPIKVLDLRNFVVGRLVRGGERERELTAMIEAAAGAAGSPSKQQHGDKTQDCSSFWAHMKALLHSIQHQRPPRTLALPTFDSSVLSSRRLLILFFGVQ